MRRKAKQNKNTGGKRKLKDEYNLPKWVYAYTNLSDNKVIPVSVLSQFSILKYSQTHNSSFILFLFFETVAVFLTGFIIY